MTDVFCGGSTRGQHSRRLGDPIFRSNTVLFTITSPLKITNASMRERNFLATHDITLGSHVCRHDLINSSDLAKITVTSTAPTVLGSMLWYSCCHIPIMGTLNAARNFIRDHRFSICGLRKEIEDHGDRSSTAHGDDSIYLSRSV